MEAAAYGSRASLCSPAATTSPPHLLHGVFGTGGVILAAPITVVVYVLVKMLYVDDPLE